MNIILPVVFLMLVYRYVKFSLDRRKVFTRGFELGVQNTKTAHVKFSGLLRSADEDTIQGTYCVRIVLNDGVWELE